MNAEEAKKIAAEAALAELPAEGTIGLGSGSTAKIFVELLGERVKNGARYVGVPTSIGTRKQAEALGIPLLGDEDRWNIDVCVDGADEVSDALDLVKGGGGAMTREKIVNEASKRNVIIVDESKLSRKLGEKWPIPLEVLPFGRVSTMQRLERWGEPKVRLLDGKPWMTDAGNFIVDLRAGIIDDPASLDRALRSIPGVVETGLFVSRASVVIVAGEDGLRKLTR
jgi:ribose 5-phosphate isomerase A